ncbi:hypothetical protein QUB80_26880 [Chlorogloeopsis sp. ULAP01]|uniref:hypothetical protein n=1 Tax=Chlorogloeopsis sp. ULAP01 TaxID=3056483 RepID=UPI0025AB3537|nr:hypothetical protein [Chlorogloeopsis sp. ULAP01]MDM9384303.1 hypothetical protein [Chlorogloeopsis sp. ULAP01]
MSSRHCKHFCNQTSFNPTEEACDRKNALIVLVVLNNGAIAFLLLGKLIFVTSTMI